MIRDTRVRRLALCHVSGPVHEEKILAVCRHLHVGVVLLMAAELRTHVGMHSKPAALASAQ